MVSRLNINILKVILSKSFCQAASYRYDSFRHIVDRVYKSALTAPVVHTRSIQLRPVKL